MSKIKNGGLYQYGAEPFEQQQFGTAGVERVKDGKRFVVVIVDVCRRWAWRTRRSRWI